MKIFMFWIGDQKQMIDRIKKIEKTYEVVIGPSVEDHNFLYKTSKFYRESYDLETWAFCSDVWRVWKLSNNIGLYIDASTILGADFDCFMDEISSFETTLFKGTDKHIETGVMWSGVTNNELFTDISNFYLYEDLDPRYMHFQPQILTQFIYKKFDFPINFDEFQHGNIIKLFTINKIRDKNTIWKTSVHSWRKGNTTNYFKKMDNDNWMDHQERFNNKIPTKAFTTQFNRLLKHGLKTPNITYIRRYYDIEKNKNKIKELNLIYKSIPYKIKFFDRLIWSKFFRIITFKRSRYSDQ